MFTLITGGGLAGPWESEEFILRVGFSIFYPVYQLPETNAFRPAFGGTLEVVLLGFIVFEINLSISLPSLFQRLR